MGNSHKAAARIRDTKLQGPYRCKCKQADFILCSNKIDLGRKTRGTVTRNPTRCFAVLTEPHTSLMCLHAGVSTEKSSFAAPNSAQMLEGGHGRGYAVRLERALLPTATQARIKAHKVIAAVLLLGGPLVATNANTSRVT